MEIEAVTAGAKVLIKVILLVLGSGCLCSGMVSGKREGYCEFPGFLWLPRESGRDTIWVTRTEYIDITTDWSSREEVKVNPTDIIVTVEKREPCKDNDENSTLVCEEKKFFESAICLSEEPGGKYRVQIERKGKSLFTCLKFVQRNANIVQVWAADEIEVNEDRLCYDGSLDRVPWPWIAREKSEWSFCPIVGGFDFKAKLHGNRKNVCSHQWRPSRFESECILGEGVHFSFPGQKCSIFPGDSLTLQLYCWGSWTEEDQTFVLLGEDMRYPQYTLRIPKDMMASPDKVYTVYFYYSPVCPVRSKGRPPGNVMYAELTMHTSEKGVCYDESENCTQFVRDGKCTNSALHKYANYCKRSCGLCGQNADLVPSLTTECLFPKEWPGDWLWVEQNRVTDVIIGRGQVSFSHLGNFLCKNKHWKNNQYKMMSHYSNGCRPRYTCMQFRRDGKLLKFQISKSDVVDRSFKLCQFADDPYPLSKNIRSSNYKILLPRSRTTFDSCGLSGYININVTFPFDISCEGSISDWDNNRCEARPLLSLSVYPCEHFDWKDYTCVAYTKVSTNYATLVTRPGKDEMLPLQCWVVKTSFNEELGMDVWSEARLLDTGQCGDVSQDDHVTINTGAVLSIRKTKERLVTKCYGSQRPYFTKTPKPLVEGSRETSGTDKETLHTLPNSNTPPTKQSIAGRIRKVPDSSGQKYQDDGAASLHNAANVVHAVLVYSTMLLVVGCSFTVR